MTPYQRILQDAVDEACASGADIVHDLGRTARWSPQQHRLWIRLDGDGSGGVSVDRLRHWSEGYASYSRKVQTLKPDGSKRLRRLIADEISLMARLQKRDLEAIARTGSRYEPAAEDLACHPVGLAIAIHAGYDPKDMCRAHLTRSGDDWRAFQDRTDAWSAARLHDTCQGRIRIRAERILFRDIECPGLTYTDLTSEGSVLTVACEMPETMMAGLAGLDLRQIVGHPALDGVGSVGIRKVARDRIGDRPAIAIHLRRVVAPLAAKETTT